MTGILFIPGIEAGDLSDKAAVDAALAGAIYWPAGTTTLCGIEVPGLLFALSASTALNPYPLALFGEGQSGALWRGTVPASLRAATDGTGEAAVGGTIARINDSSGNALHLTQASTSLRPIRGRRPKTGVRNLMLPRSQLDEAGVGRWYSNNTGNNTIASTVANDDPETSAVAPFVTAMTAGVYQFFNFLAPGVLQSGRTYRLSLRVRADAVTLTGFSGISGGTFANATGFPLTPGDGWRWVSADLVATGGRLDFYFSGQGTETSWRFATAQIELGDVMTPYQRVTSNFDITETGVESVSYAAFDQVDDALTTGAIAGGLTGQAFVAGDGGCYVSDLSIVSGGTFTLGGASHNWTGAAQGILRAVTGNTGRVLDAMIREGSFTEDEIARLERYYRALGGKGLLVPGPELIVNGGFDTDLTGWSASGDAVLAWDAGSISITRVTNANDRAWQSFPSVVGAPYIMELSIDGAAPSVRVSDAVNFTTGNFAYNGATSPVIFVASSPTSYVGLGLLANGTIRFDSVSIRRLIPREDL